MAVLQKMKGKLLEKAQFLWVFGRWQALGFYGGCGIKTCDGTSVLQRNMSFYLLPLKKKKIPKRRFLVLAMD